MGLRENVRHKTFLDVGANVGWYTFMFSVNGYRVKAFEPLQKNRNLIAATLCQNKDLFHDVQLFEFGLSNKSQHCQIFSANVNLGDGMVACDDSRKKSLRDAHHNNIHIQHVLRDSIRVERLDDIHATIGLSDIFAMKMDIERHECEALEGAQATIQTMRPKFIMVETSQSTFQCTKNWLRTYHPRRHSFHGPAMRASGDVYFHS
jgi:FkbM family methyltransferase